MSARTHLILPSQVSAWLADSRVKAVTYHRTTPVAAADLVERGVRIERSRIGAYGQGFYTVTRPDVAGGPAVLTVAVKLTTPREATEAQIADLVDNIVRQRFPRSRGIGAEESAGVRRELLSMGYDGLIIHDAGRRH